MKRDITW